MRRHALVSAVALVVALAGCSKARQNAEQPSGPGGCLGCHGGTNDLTGAPPRDLQGLAAPSGQAGRGIGAHSAHLGRGVACEECHKVPERIATPGHVTKPDGSPDGDGRAEITWGLRATNGGKFLPSYAAATNEHAGSCTVYCHAGTPSAPGSNTTPAWGDPATTCGSCHGDGVNTTGVPGGAHPQNPTAAQCASCHPDTIDSTGAVIGGGAHLNGQVDVKGCNTCHGDSARGETGNWADAAPPRRVGGAVTDPPTDPKVGAHMRHVSTIATIASRLSKPFACTECHLMPYAAGPHNPVGGVVQFGNSLASGSGTLTPSYAASNSSCASTYCHGATLPGGSNRTPVWNAVNSAPCGSCHFLANPPAPHVATDKLGAPIASAAQCAQCHPGTVNAADGSINITNGLHVNGAIDVDYHPANYSNPVTHGPDSLKNLNACKTCHGATLDGAGLAPSCTQCHAAAGHPNWLTECTFCHGDGNRAGDAAFALVGNPAVRANLAGPPIGTQRELNPSDVAVGAHQAHINPASSANGALSVQIQCTQCHGAVLPTDANHANGSVAIGWGNIATARGAGASPSLIDVAWETNPTCTNYCHGSATVPGGGSKTTPRWTAGAPEAACGTCHGFRPASWHPNNANCGQCHPGYSNSTVNPITHVNGAIDPATTSCSSCHGGLSGNNAPPYATGGETSGVKIGAHQAHVNASVLVATGFACSSCHLVPGAMRHANAQVDMAWSPLAATNVVPTPSAGSLPVASWEAAPTCTNYCHGAALAGSGGTNKLPNWTLGASQVACGTCHAAPPPLSASAGQNHPQNATCASCHGAGYATSGLTGAAKATHVNGTVNLVVGGCTACHGDRSDPAVTLTVNLASAAPGEGNGATSGDTTGTNAISAPGVGAHVAHLSRTTYRSTVLACTECHALPPSSGDRTAHVSGVGTGGARATIAWGNLAKGVGAAFNNELVNPAYAGSTSAAYGSTAGSCASTYCHGQFKNGKKATIGWTLAGGLDCNSCHGTGSGPTATHPGGSHPVNDTCGQCHGGYTAASVNALTHLNGSLEVSGMNCSTCHGDSARVPVASAAGWLDVSGGNLVAAAPPVDVNSASLSNTVGAHLAHVNQQDAPGLSSALHCSNCHTVPSGPGPHVGAGPVVVWSGLSITGGAAPAWNATNHTCASTYCHGQFSGGLPGNSVAWGTGTLGKLGCTACHANPPAHPHPQNLTCATCHAGYSSSAVTAATHVNGTVNKSTAGCTSCHGELTAAGVTLTNNLVAAAPGTTGTNTTSMDTTGQVLATAAGVGAHKAHLGAGVITHVAIACTECHALPPSNTDTTHATSGAGTGGARATLAWGATATRSVNAWSGAPVAPTYAGSTSGAGGTAGGSCASTYCHGNFNNGKNTTLGWTTVGAMTCNSCHGAGAGASATLPGGTHPQGNSTCSTCHTGYTNTSASATLHLNGRLDVAPQTCSGCHGNPARASVATATELDVNSAPLQQAAPPVGVTAANQVGAHLAHVNQGATAPPMSNALRCVNCHVVPTSGGHSDAVTTITWSDLAVSGGASPGYDSVAHSCSSTYCHGQFTGGLGVNTIAWGNGTPAKLACNACHASGAAAQPPHPHPQNTTCASCHTGYTATTVTAATHVNGSVNRSTSGCTGCHGDIRVAGVTLTVNIATAAPGATATANSMETTGLTATTAAGVGVHRAHLVATNFRAVLACTECHALPPSDADTTHGNSGAGTGGARALLTWGNLARGSGAAFNNEVVTPAYAGSTTGAGGTTGGTCASTYCHGQFKNGKKATVTWTAAGTLNCNSCHGAGAGATATLPPANHPQGNTACGNCHGGYTTAAVNALAHMNGALDVLPMTCTSCHGDVARTPVASATALDALGANLVKAAPPVDATTAAASGNLVGAHLAHVNQGATAPAWSNALRCDNCHSGMVWTTAPHATPANPIAWGNLATDGGAVTPTAYSVAAKTCSNTYCHGNWPYGRGNVTVAWGNGTPAKLACTSCHANGAAAQPPRPHPQNTTCASCHAGYTATTVAAATHVDGLTTKSTSGCTACHGDLGVAGVTLTVNTAAAAPGQTGSANSMETTGLTATTAAGVGVHRAHLVATNFRAVLACTECHALPPSNADTAHGATAVGTGGARATLTWGSLALGTGAAFNNEVVTPAYAGSTTGAGGTTGGTCASTYCHGQFKNGKKATVTWTAAGTLNCNSCHGAGAGATATLPPANHPQGNTACGNCHGGYTTAAVNALAHMNGALDVLPMTCTSCHGDVARTPVASATALDALGANLVKAAPPVDATTAAASGNLVGAHLAHVNQGATVPAWSNALRCDNCHSGMVWTTAPHATPANPIAWGNLATDGGAVTPTAYSVAAKTCSNTYCHGNWPYGRGNVTVAWGNGTPAKLACTSCHANGAAAQPPRPHPQNTTCASCHAGYTATTVTAATHVDGLTTKSTSGCTACHGDLGVAGVTLTVNTATAAPGATASANSMETTGLTATTAAGVGVHRVHLTNGAIRNALACTECHALPPSNTDTAHGATAVGTGGARATLTFGTLATRSTNNWSGAPVVPAYAGSSTGAGGTTGGSCSATYCHGNFTNGAGATPAWTASGSITCNSCHGRTAGATASPPGGTHPNNPTCGNCHTGYTATTVDLAAHMNGLLDVIPQTCTSCHGDTARTPVATATDLDALGANLVKAAPPIDSASLASGNQVGAHLAHVNQGATAPALSNALRCVNCHNGLVPVVAPHAPAANPVAFGNLATAAAAAPNAYSTATRNCANTYCHGQFTGGRTNNTVNWGNGTLAKLACTACHANGAAPQPNYPHPQNATCASCHAGYTATTVTASTHVNGTVNKSTSGCTSCHGELGFAGVTRAANTVRAAPGATGSGTNSYDTTGVATAGTNSIGAHKAHLVGSTGTPRWRTAAIACTECHALPPSDTDTSHATGTGTGGARATLAFGNLAQDTAFETKTATFARATGCTATYCHDPKSTDTTAGQVNVPSWTGATAQAQCGSCHGLPPTTAAHPANSACGSCHPGYTATAPTSASTIAAVNATAHINGALDGGGDCTGCHASAQAINNGPLAGTGSRRAIVGEFKNTWSHKRSTSGGVPANTVVTKYDCGVCHMEGDAKTGDTTAAHQDGYVDLRDPDTGVAIKYANWGGANAGAYTSNATDVKMSRFSRNLSSASLEPEAVSVMINQCLHCHDANGATAAAAQVTGGSPGRPFNTTITGNGYIAGYDISATNTAGSVVNVSTSFDVTNAAYHPVKGKQNNSYVSALRMNAPWNVLTKAGGNLTSWGYLITCWDCHAPVGASGVQTSTVTAHGAVATLRQDNWIVNATNLCTVCHNVVPAVGSSTSTHGQGSAWQSSGNGTPGGIARTSCWRCHGSTGTARPARPYAAQDAHGVDSFSPAMGSDRLWPVGATDTWKPYAFFRSAGTAGQWNGTVSWRPLSGPGVPAGSAVCSATTTGGSTSGSLNGCGSQNHGPYTPGGMY